MDYTQINKLLELLKKYDSSYKVFGSEIHKYEVHPTLGEAKIADFEAKEGIKLPKSYRDYLKRIGNGGAGPGYGVYTLSSARDCAGFYEPIEEFDHKKKRSNEDPGELLIVNNGCGLFT